MREIGRRKDGTPVTAYVVGKGPNAVVVFHDVFGLHTGRHKQIADTVSRSVGGPVVVPDFFEGEGGGLFGREEQGYGNSASKLGKFMIALVFGRMKAFQKAHPWDPECEAVWSDAVAPFLKSDEMITCTKKNQAPECRNFGSSQGALEPFL